jgi:hypothetical protein
MEHDGMGDGSGIYEEPCFYCSQFNAKFGVGEDS